MRSFCICKRDSHVFSKNTCELDILSSRTVNILTTNELVKLTMLWTTRPWIRKIQQIKFWKIYNFSHKNRLWHFKLSAWNVKAYILWKIKKIINLLSTEYADYACREGSEGQRKDSISSMRTCLGCQVVNAANLGSRGPRFESWWMFEFSLWLSGPLLQSHSLSPIHLFNTTWLMLKRI